MTKESVIKVVNNLPDEFELDVLLEKLIVIAKIERGLKDVEEGRTKTFEEAKRISKSWSK
jgi:hypothetical protein